MMSSIDSAKSGFLIRLIFELPSSHSGGLVMDMQQSLPGEPNEYGSPLDVDDYNENHPAPYISVFSNHEQCQSVTESTQHSSYFSPINVHYTPNHPITMTTVTAPLAPSSVLPNPPRSKFSKTSRNPRCPHARCVLEDKPPRTAIANENIECTNCGTRITSTWRRSADGKSECNACNLFFRKNGRQRPASMRRDTVARRYRLSRCDLCVREAEGNPENFGQLEKPVPRRRRNGKSASKSAIPQNSSVQPSDFNQSQSSAVENFFVRPDASFAQSLPRFISSNVPYNTQNTMMMSYSTEPTMFSAINTEQQRSPSEMNDPHSFTRLSPNAFLGADVYGSQVLACDQNTEENQKEPYRSFVEHPAEQQLEESDIFNNSQLEDRYSEAYAIVNEEYPNSSFLNCSFATHESSFEFDSASATVSGNALNETSDLFQNDDDDDRDESVPVFQVL